MYQQGLHCIADRGPGGLCVDDDTYRHVEVSGAVNKCMADTGTGLNHRNSGIGNNLLDESCPAAGNYHINESIGVKDSIYRTAVGEVNKAECPLRYACTVGGLSQDIYYRQI